MPNQPFAADDTCHTEDLSREAARQLERRGRTGYVMPGWSAGSWAKRLRQLAASCESLAPELAAEYRRWAANVKGRQP